MTSGPSPMCLSCVHYDQTTPADIGSRPKCAAFPEGIPDAIYFDGRVDHRGPWPGDKGIRFEQDPLRAPFPFDLFTETRGQPGPVRAR